MMTVLILNTTVKMASVVERRYFRAADEICKRNFAIGVAHARTESSNVGTAKKPSICNRVNNIHSSTIHTPYIYDSFTF